MSTSPTHRLPRVRASELTGRNWLNTGGRSLTLADLRGKILLIDFWTFCCVNCLHVIDELRELEAAHRDVLVTIGVHSPKFEHEADPAALAAAVERYEVHHPVLDDPDLVTWQAYTARAWPTLVVVDPEGYVVAQMAGEGHGSAIAVLVRELIEEHEAKGTLRCGDGPPAAAGEGGHASPAPEAGTLRFPAKAIELPGGNLLVADAGHHSLAELAPDGVTLVRRIGSGERGLVDGGPDEARFSEPNGLCLLPAWAAEAEGYDVVVADTVNHALRGVRLSDGEVRTLAGTGRQFMVGGAENVRGEDGRWRPFVPGADDDRPDAVNLSSPWDVVYLPERGVVLVAMAGSHTLWEYDPGEEALALVAGTMNEGLEDGEPAGAWFAQPSGLAVDETGRVWLADAETSALRWFDPAEGRSVGPVRTAVGQGLFDFGHRDGAAGEALLQHPLGVASLPDGSVVVADTYNGALRRYDPVTGRVSTLARGLAEPSGVVVHGAGGTAYLLVVESAAHRLTRVELPAGTAGDVLDTGARRTRRPVTDVVPGRLRLEVPFEPAPGQKLDDRWGPSTELQVGATPPELLLAGAGKGTDLVRDLEINPDVPEGTLHVTAKAASCDVVPTGPDGAPVPDVFPACHLAQQDWGVPLRVTDRPDPEPATLVLPLRG